MLVNFNMDRIKTIMKFEGPLNLETSYRARMAEGNQDLDAVTRDICIEGAIWSLGARNNPLYLKRSDLNPVARGWHEFIIHNIMPTTNQSEVTLNRAVLIHCIMSSQEISFLASGPVEAMPKARAITPAVMENIRHPPVQPFNPQQHYHHEQPADGYGWGQLQEDMANMSNMYTHWALQQANQNLVPMIPTKIPPAIRENFRAGRPLLQGMLRPWPPEGSSSALGQQATPAIDVPRNPNANTDDEN
ncbi:hypothetical protein PIB30_097055 [Stylosanthes scabra]|uniref:Putative plant transposon protein domain-containing protein n=1 Tax=Stylosanthes scabra TaxID=79078 RepID=A0ABU6TVQ9_9FABA|nr:hypothetical protein [Stylosanthes scabra]